MSEKMYPIPFRSLMNWVITEYAGCGDVFGGPPSIGKIRRTFKSLNPFLPHETSGSTKTISSCFSKKSKTTSSSSSKAYVQVEYTKVPPGFNME